MENMSEQKKSGLEKQIDRAEKKARERMRVLIVEWQRVRGAQHELARDLATDLDASSDFLTALAQSDAAKSETVPT
jgi:hypothetical protein